MTNDDLLQQYEVEKCFMSFIVLCRFTQSNIFKQLVLFSSLTLLGCYSLFFFVDIRGHVGVCNRFPRSRIYTFVFFLS